MRKSLVGVTICTALFAVNYPHADLLIVENYAVLAIIRNILYFYIYLQCKLTVFCLTIDFCILGIMENIHQLGQEECEVPQICRFQNW